MSIHGDRVGWVSVLAFVLAAWLLAYPAYSQDRTGVWQGTLQADARGMFLELRLSKAQDGSWKAELFNADEFPNGLAASSVTLKDPVLKLAFTGIFDDRYDAKFEGESLVGTFSRDKSSWPLTLKHVDATTAQKLDSSPHKTQFVEVQPGVKLEVLSWGGSGRPLIFIPGGAGTAHRFDEMALHFAKKHRVYAITRRGSGSSSTPPAVKWDGNGNYASDRLGDDVLAVMAALKIERPVLVGHSRGGAELSSVCSRHPEKVAGLIYLDAVAGYSFFNHGRLVPRPPANATFEPVSAQEAIHAGQKEYTKIPCPVLALIAVPHLKYGPNAKAEMARDRVNMTRIADEFEAGVPTARVVRLKDADHQVWVTHGAEVLREMDAFLNSLR